MFAAFIEAIHDLIASSEQAGSIDRILAHYEQGIEPLNDLAQIQRHFILSIVPNQMARFLRNQPSHLEGVRRSVFKFGGYLSQNQMGQLLEGSILGMLPPRDKQHLGNQLLGFIYHQNRWHDGSWNKALKSQPAAAFQSICSHLEYQNDWDCARFLSCCGYAIPHSLRAFQGFLKWSGESYNNSDHEIWWGLLRDQSPEHHALYRLDRKLDCLFNPKQSLFKITLCLSPASCTQCGLRASCRFYQLQRKPQITEIPNQIKTGEISSVTSTDLLKTISGEAWFDSEFQRALAAAFPHISIAQFTDATDAADEMVLCRLMAVKEISDRREREDDPIIGKSFTSAIDIYHFFADRLANEAQESFYAVILDNKHRIIKERLISLGTLNQSLVHPREVFATAIQVRAAAIVLVHNHPSGDPSPSNQDIAITQRLQDVGEIIGIKVLDHVIIGSDNFFSFVDENLIG